MDESNFFCRNTPCNQLCLDIVIHIELAFAFSGWSGQIAEDDLGELLLCSICPDLKGSVHAGVYLTARMIREKRIGEPLVKSDLPSVIGHFEHVVYGWVYCPGAKVNIKMQVLDKIRM